MAGEQASREMRFDECGIEVKVNRLRDAVMSLSVMLEHASNQATRAVRVSESHQHGDRGEVLMPLDNGANQAMAIFDRAEGAGHRIRRLLG